MTTGLHEHYQAVHADLLARRKKLTEELADIDATVASIQRMMGVSPHVSPSPVASAYTDRSNQPAINYSKMSVRWAVLAFLAEVAVGPMGTGAIADALQSRGVVKEGPSRFGNIVSAVVSHLKTKGEVEAVDDGLYQLTSAGRAMWMHIRGSAKFRQTQGLSTSPGLLDVR